MRHYYVNGNKLLMSCPRKNKRLTFKKIQYLILTYVGYI